MTGPPRPFFSLVKARVSARPSEVARKSDTYAGEAASFIPPALEALGAPSNMKELTLFGTGALALFNFERAAFSEPNTVLYCMTGVLQNLMDIAIQIRRAPVPPPAAAVYGTIQGALSGLRTWIYYGKPLGRGVPVVVPA